MCRVEGVADGLKAANRSLLTRINEWPDHLVHYCMVGQEPSSDAAVSTGVQGDIELPSCSQVDVDTQRTQSSLHSRATEQLIDKVPMCIGLRITGSGAQMLTKHIMKAALLVLSHPTFSLTQVQEAEGFQLIPATRNQDLGVASGLLVPVYTGMSRVVPKILPHKDLGFKIASKGVLCSLCDMFTNLASTTSLSECYMQKRCSINSSSWT